MNVGGSFVGGICGLGIFPHVCAPTTAEESFSFVQYQIRFVCPFRANRPKILPRIISVNRYHSFFFRCCSRDCENNRSPHDAVLGSWIERRPRASRIEARTGSGPRILDAPGLLDSLRCGICTIIPIDAVETDCCGNLFCYRCLNVPIRKVTTCPICRFPDEKEDTRTFCWHRNMVVRRMIENYVEVECDFCEAVMPQKNLYAHRVEFHSPCVWSFAYACHPGQEACTWRGKKSEVEHHGRECPFSDDNLRIALAPEAQALVQYTEEDRRYLRGRLGRRNQPPSVRDLWEELNAAQEFPPLSARRIDHIFFLAKDAADLHRIFVRTHGDADTNGMFIFKVISPSPSSHILFIPT